MEKKEAPSSGWGASEAGAKVAERIKLDPPYSAGGSNVGGENILPTLGPIPLGRSALVRGFTPDICLFAPEISLMEPHVTRVRAHMGMLPTSGQPSLAPR